MSWAGGHLRQKVIHYRGHFLGHCFPVLFILLSVVGGLQGSFLLTWVSLNSLFRYFLSLALRADPSYLLILFSSKTMSFFL